VLGESFGVSARGGVEGGLAAFDDGGVAAVVQVSGPQVADAEW